MRRHAMGAVLLAMAGTAAAEPSFVEAGGVRFETRASVGGKPLMLNGVGVRYRAIFKVAAISLYLAARADTADAALASPGPKRIHMVMLRTVNANDVGKILSTGIEANATRQEFIAVLPGIARIGEVSAQMKTMSPGDSVTIDWSPGAGATYSVNGKVVAGPYADFGAFSGIAKIWLGKAVADAPLKEALLGRSSAAPDGDAASLR